MLWVVAEQEQVVAQGEGAGVVEEGEKAGLQQDREDHMYAPNAVMLQLTQLVHLATNRSVLDAESRWLGNVEEDESELGLNMI